MGLKCSLLGHSYEPADFERDRKEEGSEVVTIHREIERCVRCGEERVVSESTEVAAVVDEDDVEFSDSGRVGADHPAVDDAVGTGTGETAPTADVEAAGTGDEADEGPVRPDEETLSGLTVPEGTIVCTDCAFSVDADSAYREGDPCPDCGAWLTSERNP